MTASRKYPGTSPIGGDEKERAFNEWWDKRGLSGDHSRHPLYLDNRPHPLNRPNKLGHPLWQSYRNLYRLGADLDLVDGILCCFADRGVLEKRRTESAKKIPAPAVPSQEQSKSRASLANMLREGRPLRDASHIKLDVVAEVVGDAVRQHPDVFRDAANLKRFREGV